jgi:Amt family ammonium transporter
MTHTRFRLSMGIALAGLFCVGLALAPTSRAEDLPAGQEPSTASAGLEAAPAPAEDAKPAEPAPKPFQEMTTDEKLDALAGSALELNGDGTVKNKSLYTDANILWTCVAAFLVFFMQAGFAFVESGLTRAKNACNILMKNVMDFCIGSLAYWAVGFGLMFGVTSFGVFGTSKWFFDAGTDNFSWAFLIFQTVFCATAATIVSGAMAERTKFSSYLIYTFFISLVIYPIFGKWAWGSLSGAETTGWLCGGEGSFLESIFGSGAAFHDFAGSTVVHSIGGWCALAGAIVVGPRLGKFAKDGKVNAIPGHNLPYVVLGVFVLWIGWFGFNPGSTTAVGGGSLAFIAVTTNLAACAGGLTAMFVSWIMFKKPDPSMVCNGILAGLVAITAGCDKMHPIFAVITGGVGGVLVVLSVVGIDRLKIDDPVGAISVHAVNGVWGTLAIGLFKTGAGLLVGGGTQQILVQLVGIIAAGAWAFSTSFVLFLAIKYTVGLRVSEVEEIEGLDIHEHGMLAYPSALVVENTMGTPLAAPKTAPGGYVALGSAQPSPEGA